VRNLAGPIAVAPSRGGVPGDVASEWELTPELERLDAIVSDEGGLVHRVERVSDDSAPFPVFTATLGDLESLHPHIRSTVGARAGVELAGSGGDRNPRRARAIAIAEAVERHASCVPRAELRWASAAHLGSEAIDLDALPRCSPTELADPRCPVRPVDPAEPIRWTRGWSSRGRGLIWVPAALVWMHLEPLTASERLTMPISTGCATHSDPARAVLNGLCEVIERDAIAVTWLQRLPLREIQLSEAPRTVREAVDRAEAAGRRHRFFDATSDLGVPTIYCVDTDPTSERLRHVVMCATELDPSRAIVKILREIASSRIALGAVGDLPDSVDDFRRVVDGARYMGSSRRAHAFDFLLDSGSEPISFSDLARIDDRDAGRALTNVVERLHARGCEVVVVDISTVEARSVGLTVVRAIIPQLMPLSFAHRARFLAHPRLYEAPRAFGRAPLAEADLNPFPQPFA